MKQKMRNQCPACETPAIGSKVGILELRGTREEVEAIICNNCSNIYGHEPEDHER